MIAELADAERTHLHTVTGILTSTDIGDIAVHTVFPAVADPALTYPYLVVTQLPSDVLAASQDIDDITITHRWQVTAVGRTVDETVGALGRARMAYTSTVPQVPGWVCWPITNLPGGAPVQQSPTGSIDQASGLVLLYGSTLFSYRASIAR